MMTNKLSINKRIEYLIRARYPLLYLVSYEEARVEKALESIADERVKKVYKWSITKGMECPDGTTIKDLREPLKALDHIVSLDVNGIFILRDFHHFIKDPVVIRKLRDVHAVLKNCMKNIILLSPVLKIVPEIEKEIAVIDYDLPDKNEIKKIIEQVGRVLPDTKNIDIYKDPFLYEKVVEAALGLTAEEIENVLAKSLVQSGQFEIDIILSEKEQIIRKSGILEFYKSSDDMKDIGGLQNLKVWLNKRTRTFTKEARDFGLPNPKGIIMLGVPGCGKSLTAKAISSLWKLPLLRLDVGKVFSSLVGSSEENVRKAIQTAEAIAPSILWLDELEKGFSGVQSSGQTDSGTTARVFGTFLTWLQEKESPVFVVATSNNIQGLPPELLRKGRFDEIFFIDLPFFNERKEIFKIHLQKKERDLAQFDIEEMAGMTEGYSGSEIEQIVIAGLYDAFDNNRDLTQADIIHNIKEIIPISQTMKENIDSIKEWAKIRAKRASIGNDEEEAEKVRKIEMS